MLVYAYSLFLCSLSEAPVLLEITSHLVKTFQIPRLGPVDSKSSELVSATITLLLEVLSITIRVTTETSKIQKDEPLQLLTTMIKDWIQAKIGNCQTTQKIFGGGVKKGGWTNQGEDFVDLPQEFKVYNTIVFDI